MQCHYCCYKVMYTIRACKQIITDQETLHADVSVNILTGKSTPNESKIKIIK